MAGTPDPKPARRIVDRDALPLGWRWSGTVGARVPVHEQGEGLRPVCLACGVSGSWGTCSRFHLVPKGKGGDDVPENLCWACGDGTRGCHGTWEGRLDKPAPGTGDLVGDGHHMHWDPVFPQAKAWQLVGAAIRRGLTGEQLLYVLTKQGPAYLDVAFPVLGGW